MRILAIRGQNLASLAGHFAIDFTAEPLAESGIFAITGPTGAGKSTLLDAVCLALFNEIPRLKTAPARGKIGDDEDSGLSLQDTRAILRHGTTEGYAEVDFAMPGGPTYRARWSVRRARGRVGGQIQNNTHDFERLDTGERMGGTRRETLAAIRDVVGLTAEQFGRAVLLAQGDFEAFICADANERAILLERLTGSQIYTALGQRAFAKAKAHKEGLEGIGRQIAGMNGLDDEHRAAAEQALAAAQEAEDEASRQYIVLDDARRWEARAAELAQAVTTARNTLAASEAQDDMAAPRRNALARDRMALAHAPAWSKVNEAAAAVKEAAGLAEKATEARTTTQQVERQARKDEEVADTACKEVAEKAAAVAAGLSDARKLDIRLHEAELRQGNAETDAEAGQAKLTEAKEASGTARVKHQEAESARQTAQNWLDSHPALEPLALRESELAEQLTQRAVQMAAIAKDETARASHEQGQQTAIAQWSKAEDALGPVGDVHQKAKAALAQAEAVLPPHGRLDELTDDRDRITRLNGLLETFLTADEKFAEAGAALEKTRQLQSNAEMRVTELTEQEASYALAAEGLNQKVTDARRELDLLTAAASDTAETLRATLTDDEPCPVCGAVEHNLAVFEGRLGNHLRERREALAALAADHTKQLGDALKAGAGRKAHLAQIPQLQHEHAEQVTMLAAAVRHRDDAQANLDSAAKAMGLPHSAAELPQPLAARRREVEDALGTVRNANATAAQARSEEKTAREALDTAKAEHDAARKALDIYTLAIKDLDSTLKTGREAADRLSTGLDRWLAPVVDWRARPDPAAWIAEQAASWHGQVAQRDRHARELPALLSAKAHAEAELAGCGKRADELAAALTVAATAHTDLAKERAALLDGENVDAVEQRIALARETAAAEQKRTRASREAATNASTAAATHHDGCVTQHNKAQGEHTACESVFNRALAASGLTAEEVARIAQAGEAALEAEATALAALQNAVQTNRVRLDDREKDLTQHEASDRPELSGLELAAAIIAAEAARDGAVRQRGEAELKIGLDDKVREQTAQLRAELERKTAQADVWLRLSDLIGDANGATFRRFAQGLTLDRLLEHANARMAELKPRYTLQRGAGGDMLIQVLDNDMGGEIRGLHNLSGGERFLVSLALALGLAEMSTAGGVKIESLFIDEGFGALDPASLGQAIALLEHLHAAGRRVGVISHVEELKERIAVKIEVTPTGRGTSQIEVVGI